MRLKSKYLALILAFVFTLTVVLPVSNGNNIVQAAGSVTVTLQNGLNGYSGAMDVENMNPAWLGGYSAGQATVMSYLYPNNSAVMYFDVSQLPVGAVIDSAKLSLVDSYVYDSGTLSMYRITDPDNLGLWKEGTRELGDEGSDGTSFGYRDISAGVKWTNTVGSTILDCRTSTATGTIPIEAINETLSPMISSDVKNDVQAWVDGSATNQGWMLDASVTIGFIESSQSAVQANRPKLDITYHVGAVATPTPVVTPAPVTTPSGPVNLTLQNGLNGYSGAMDVDMIHSTWLGGYCAGQATVLNYLGPDSSAVMYFDLSQIPSDAIIDSATLGLVDSYVYDNSALSMTKLTDPDNLGLWSEGVRVLGDEGNDGVSFGFRNSTGAVPWTSTIGSTILDCRATEATGTIPFTAINETLSPITSSDVKADIQSWVDGSAVNQGWMLETPVGIGFIESCQSAVQANRPKLTITYHVGEIAPTPTPTVAPSGPLEISLQNGLNGYTGAMDNDSMHDGWTNGWSAGQSPTLSYLGLGYSAMMYFDVSQIPSDAVIDSATLDLVDSYVYDNSEISMFKITDPDHIGLWKEGTKLLGAEDSDGVSFGFRSYTDAIPWTNTVGSTVMDCRAATASGTIPFTAINETLSPITSTDLKADIQSWVNGSAVNQGWMLDTPVGIGFIESCQSTVQANRPKLTIKYHVGEVVITPTPEITAVPTPTPAPTPTPMLTGAPATPVPPRLLDTTYALPTGGTVIKVNAGDNLQTALNSANPGDIIELAAGATFTGQFRLPKKTGNDWIYITSSAYSNLPAPGTRVSPADQANMPKIITPGDYATITAAKEANHFRFVGIEIATTFETLTDRNYNIIDLTPVGSFTQVSELPNNITFDRCYIHGTPEGNVKRGITANCASLAVIDSYISDIHGVGFDTQAIAGFNGCGPFKIVNNYLEAACENIMFGGADALNETFQPQDIEVRGNYLFKPLSWKVGDPSYAGIEWSVKNIFELKSAQRVLVEGNVLENNWIQADQAGYAVVFTPRNQGGGNNWTCIKDVLFKNNIVKNSNRGLMVMGIDDSNPSVFTQRIEVSNNVFKNIDPLAQTFLPNVSYFGGQVIYLTLGGTDIVINHNDIIQTDAILLVNGMIQRFAFTNNLTQNKGLGISSRTLAGDRLSGDAVIDTFFPGGTFTKNIIAGGDPSTYVKYTGNFMNPPATLNDVGFVDFAGGDYQLSTSSLYKNAGTDGKAIGADISAVKLATRGAISGTTSLLGDVNGDGLVLTSDALMVLKAVTGKVILTDAQKIVADVTKNGKVQSTDALMILKYCSGKITSF